MRHRIPCPGGRPPDPSGGNYSEGSSNGQRIYHPEFPLEAEGLLPMLFAPTESAKRFDHGCYIGEATGTWTYVPPGFYSGVAEQQHRPRGEIPLYGEPLFRREPLPSLPICSKASECRDSLEWLSRSVVPLPPQRSGPRVPFPGKSRQVPLQSRRMPGSPPWRCKPGLSGGDPTETTPHNSQVVTKMNPTAGRVAGQRGACVFSCDSPRNHVHPSTDRTPNRDLRRQHAQRSPGAAESGQS